MSSRAPVAKTRVDRRAELLVARLLPLGHEPAVDVYVRARHKRGAFSGEEEHGVRNIYGLSKTTNGMQFGIALVKLSAIHALRLHEFVYERRLNTARVNCEHANLVRRIFQRKLTSQR